NTTYYFKIYNYDKSGNFTPSNEVYGLTINGNPAMVTLNPITVKTATSVTLNWTQSTDQDFSSYKVFRSVNPNVSTSETQIADIPNSGQLTQMDTTVTENVTYYYRIFVVDKKGAATGSNTQAVTVPNGTPGALTLNAPTNVTPTNATLSWSQATVNDFASYKLFRSENPNVGTTDVLIAMRTVVTETTFTDTTEVENHTYYFRVFLYDTSGTYSDSNTQSIKKPNAPPPTIILNPLTNITPTSVTLNWTQPAIDDFDYYKIVRTLFTGTSTTDVVFQPITSIATTTYQDTTVQENSNYLFKIYVYDKSGSSTPSNSQSLGAPNGPPPASTLNAPTNVSSSSASISWTSVAISDFLAYKLYRSDTGFVDTSDVYLINTFTNINTTSFIDTTLAENTAYKYLVCVFDKTNLGTKSNVQSITTLNASPPTMAFSPFSTAPTYIVVSWTQTPILDFSKYVLYRSDTSTVDTTSVKILESTTKSTTSYTDSPLVENKTYYYRIYLFDTAGVWSQSGSQSAITANGPPAAVTLSPLSGVTSSSLTLAWTQSNEPDFASYKVFRSTTPGAGTTSIEVASVTTKTTLTQNDTGLTENTMYYYKIFVYDTGGKYAGSNEQSATTGNSYPPAVTLSSVANTSPASATAVTINWTQSGAADFSSYKIYRSTSSTVGTTDVQ
ncbi:MAG: fibronectin type III domain-containing protein, partial [Candidatus Kerfeldbacteria bacterium]|nr:fibronectin type III domain-containing protein [Candidatus Kerfeldbacteria bacterium]